MPNSFLHVIWTPAFNYVFFFPFKLLAAEVARWSVWVYMKENLALVCTPRLICDVHATLLNPHLTAIWAIQSLRCCHSFSVINKRRSEVRAERGYSFQCILYFNTISYQHFILTFCSLVILHFYFNVFILFLCECCLSVCLFVYSSILFYSVLFCDLILSSA